MVYQYCPHQAPHLEQSATILVGEHPAQPPDPAQLQGKLHPLLAGQNKMFKKDVVTV
jgi:hypothetical protein